VYHHAIKPKKSFRRKEEIMKKERNKKLGLNLENFAPVLGSPIFSLMPG
jgi:hypothetical protein